MGLLAANAIACSSKPAVAHDPRLPFALDLAGYQRTDAGTVATYRNGDRLVQLVPRIAPPTDEQLDRQIEIAAHLLDPHEKQTARNGHQITFGKVEALGELVGGFVVIRACLGPPHGFFDPLERVSPDMGFTLDHGLRLPNRAWYFTGASAGSEGNVYGLPDLQATLGIRRLDVACDALASDPKELAASVSQLTIASATRTATGVRATTADDRPAVLDLVCRDGKLVEVMLRGVALTPEMTATLDQVIQEPGSAMRDASSSKDRAQ